MNASNYPPGVTGNEPQIAGDESWEQLHEMIDADAQKRHWSDMDVFVAWRLGVAALEAARKLNAHFPHD